MDQYDSHTRRVFMITELYYGNIKILLDSNFETEEDAKVSELDLGMANITKIQKKIEYTFKSTNVHFTMHFELVKSING